MPRICCFGLHTRKQLQRYLSRRPGCAPSDRVFLKGDLSPVSGNTIRQLFDRLKTRAGIPRLKAHLSPLWGPHARPCKRQACSFWRSREGLHKPLGQPAFLKMPLESRPAIWYTSLPDRPGAGAVAPDWRKPAQRDFRLVHRSTLICDGYHYPRATPRGFSRIAPAFVQFNERPPVPWG